MKSRINLIGQTIRRIAVIPAIAVAIVAVFSCETMGSSNSGTSAKSALGSSNSETSASTGGIYTGDGGKGIRIAVLIPEASGLTADQNYLPTVVQGVLVDNFSRYSAISVLDRVALEKTLKETESGIYKNENDYGQLGAIANVDYALTGGITKTGSGYTMQIRVVGTGKDTIGVTKASYSGNCTINDLNNHTGVRKASMELLTQMGINLTDKSKKELSGASDSANVNAQKTLAQGIVAQRDGDEFGAMLKYFDAKNYDRGLTEVTARMLSSPDTYTASIGTSTNLRDRIMGTITQEREQIRLEAERKAKAKELLNRATSYYKAHQPFEIILGNTFTLGNIDRNKETVEIGVSMTVNPIKEEFEIIRNLELQAINMGFGNWPFTFQKLSMWRNDSFLSSNSEMIYAYIDTSQPGMQFKESSWSGSSIINTVDGIWKIIYRPPMFAFEAKGNFGLYPISHKITVRAAIENSNGKTIKTLTFPVSGEIKYGVIAGGTSSQQQFSVNINDLTDTLTMRIVSIDGKSIGSILANGYVKVEQPVKVLTTTY